MTIIKDNNNYSVVNFTESQKEKFLNIAVPNLFILEDTMNEIKETLKLDEAQSVEELRAVRNSVVNLLRPYLEKDMGQFYWNLLSGATAVVDNEMVNRFHTL